MHIQIVNSATGEVVATKHGLKLEDEIAPHTDISRLHPFARYRRKVLLVELSVLLDHLRPGTRFV